jgi:hypothetical protein
MADPGVAPTHHCWPTNASTTHTTARRAATVASNRSFRNAGPRDKGLGKLRYGAENLRLLHQFRRLAMRRQRRISIHDRLVSLACVLICWRRLINWISQRSC